MNHKMDIWYRNNVIPPKVKKMVVQFNSGKTKSTTELSPITIQIYKYKARYEALKESG